MRSRWIGDFCDHISTRCAGIPSEPAIGAIGAIGQTETRQRPSGAHLLLLVDDVETWNSKLKEMDGG